MANGHPTFGGSNGVPVLDIGQLGGTRQLAGNALFTGQVIRGADEVATAEHGLPEQNVRFRENMGFAGRSVRIEGIIRAKTLAIMTAIIDEMNQRKHGSARDELTGNLATADPTLVRETQLTDSDGAQLADRAVLENWRPKGPRLTGQEWLVLQEITIDIRVLG